MDKEAVRKQVAEEIQAEYESKLKQARRQKQQAEEELESASERWRTEKRRLNAEIDRLEAALAEAKETRAKRGSSEQTPAGVDPVAVARIQDAADQKLKKAATEWEAERRGLQSQIVRLEIAVAEAIERSNNPMRATQAVREQFEAQLNQIARERTELEQALLRGKTEWEQEKLKMTGEMLKLRRAAQMMGKPVPRDDTPGVKAKTKDIEHQLESSLAKWNHERETLLAEIERLETASQRWGTERRELNDHAGQLQQAFVQAQAKIQTYEAAARTGTGTEVKVEELEKQKDALDQVFRDARDAWDSERRRLISQVERLEQQLQRVSKEEGISSEVVDQLRKQYELKIQEAIEQKTQLAQQLQNASGLLESERARLTTEITQAKDSSGGVNSDAISKELTRVEAMIRDIVELIDDPATELSTVIRKNVEKAELDAYLKGILFSTAGGRGL